MFQPFPSSSSQPGNPSSALSRLAPTAPVVSPASAGSQQAINMLKEQNRLLTKVSGGDGEETRLQRRLGGSHWGKSMRQLESVPSIWPTLVILEKGCGLHLEPFHVLQLGTPPVEGHVSSYLLGEGLWTWTSFSLPKGKDHDK